MKILLIIDILVIEKEESVLPISVKNNLTSRLTVEEPTTIERLG